MAYSLPTFDNEMVLRFIRNYRDNQCLWDFSSPAYKNKTARDEAYERLVDAMDMPGLTVMDVKNKIKNIRSTYCQELKKIQTARMLGREPYTPSVFWFKELDSFLHANTTPRTDLGDKKVPKYLKKMNHDRVKVVTKRYCSYNGCSSDSVTTNNGAISFFGFPKDTERCSKWITNSGREEFRYLTPRELSGKKLCELHFHPSMFSNQFKTNLKKAAFPMNWKNAIPELIQIDDDDDDVDDVNENEYSLGNDIENVVDGVDVHELSDDNSENGLNGDLSSNSNQVIGDSNIEVEINTSQEPILSEVVSNTNSSEKSVENQMVPAVTSSTSIEEISIPDIDKSSSKSIETSADKTKFHNLPSQTTQGEFYYQQCPSVEETSHSYPEPPEGEMPLFVQQNSVVSMADDNVTIEAAEPPPKRRKLEQDTEITAQMNNAMKYLKDITELLTTSEDEFELFGKSVALQLKKMSLCTALAVQAKVQQVLSQYRIMEIKKKELKQKDCVAGVNGMEEEKTVGPEENSAKPISPHQLSLECDSEPSDSEVDGEK